MRQLKITIIMLIVLIPTGLIGLLFFALVGPKSRPITPQELVGKYSVLLPDNGQEILQLLSNGTCEQDILLKKGSSYHATGKWHYNQVHYKNNSQDELILEGVRQSLNIFGNKINPKISEISKESRAGLPIFRSLIGHIKIGIYGDLGEYYQKIE